MKNALIISFLILTFPSFGQAYLNDQNFSDHLESRSAFGDDEHSYMVVEFWISWNSSNSLNDWEKIKSAKYYRVDVGVNSDLKNKYDIMIAPTIIIFVDGVEQQRFKAGLDMKCPVGAEDIISSLGEIKKSFSF
jgi:hypothetical protein